MLLDLQAAEIRRHRLHLTDCLDWMEQTRASGDCGNWDWAEDDVYTAGRASLAVHLGVKPTSLNEQSEEGQKSD